jgi:hypothetical protein
LNYFQQFDKAAGSRALGPDQTLSGKVQQTLSHAAAQAKSVDEQKGYTKVAHDVCIFVIRREFKLGLNVSLQAVLF